MAGSLRGKKRAHFFALLYTDTIQISLLKVTLLLRILTHSDKKYVSHTYYKHLGCMCVIALSAKCLTPENILINTNNDIGCQSFKNCTTFEDCIS